jgi:hypothetical protein
MPPAAPARLSPQPVPFVSGLAWSFIGLSGLSMILALIPAILLAFVVPLEPLRASVAEAVGFKLLPPLAMAAVDYLPTLFMVLFAGSLLTFVVSIALLKRKNWARIAFTWIMIVTAAIHLAGLALPFYLRHDFFAAVTNLPPDLRGMGTTVAVMLAVTSSVIGIAFAGFFSWVAKRLFSADIRQEFLAQGERISS